MIALPLRKATLEDLPALTRLADQSWREANADALPEATLDALTQNNGLAGLMASHWTSIWVAEHASGLVGIAAADEDAHIWLLYVAPDAQGRGIGTSLLDHILRLLAEDHAEATLDVMDGNTAALAFYTARGWTEQRRYRVDLPNTTATAIRLTYKLG